MTMLLTDKEVADIFRVSRTTVWNWVRLNDSFPKPKRYNGATRWLAEDVHEYVKSGGDDDVR